MATYPKSIALANFEGFLQLEVKWFNANSGQYEITECENEAERNLFIAQKDGLLLSQLIKDFCFECHVMLASKKFADRNRAKTKATLDLLFIHQSALAGIQHYIDQVPNCNGKLPFDPIIINECAATIAQCLEQIDLTTAIQVPGKVVLTYALLVDLGQKAFNRYAVSIEELTNTKAA